MAEIPISVDFIIPGSIADDVGIMRGDEILTINGKRPLDLIDYRFLCAGEEVEVEVRKQNGEIWVCDIEKEYDEDLGLGFTQDTFDGIRKCANKCIFCFVDQMPEGLRESLYVKDDDYRLSFLHGNFITLTNLTETDMKRIVDMRLSPLYISVHCTGATLREEMLGHRKAGNIMAQLVQLAKAGIEMHTQIVLCPGVNDGQELTRTVQDLTSLWPQVLSVAVVPVGLTGHRGGLFPLRKFTPSDCMALIDQVNSYQKIFFRKFETPLVYLADEFYVMARKEFPNAAYYGGFPQLENGVGLVRLFYDSFADEKARLPRSLPRKRQIALVTGVSGEYILRPVTDCLNEIDNLHADLVGVANKFFGGHVTVAGLLTGEDVLHTLRERGPYELIMLPSVMCKRDEPVFLDGMTVSTLENELRTPVRVINIDEGARQLIEEIID